MTGKKRLVATSMVIIGLALFGALAGYWFFFDQSTEPNPPQYNTINYIGDVDGGQAFSMNGTLHQNTLAANHDSFGNVSLRLYAADGSLRRGICLGTISTATSINISLRQSTLPEYAIFASPDFQEADTVSDFTLDYYYRDNGDYMPGTWAIPSDLPIDVTRHDPCS